MSSILHVVSWNDDLDHRLTPIVQACAERGVVVWGVAGPEVDPSVWPELSRSPMNWVDVPTGATVRSFRRDVRTLERLVSRHRPTVVHIHAGPLAPAAHLASSRSGIGRRVYSTAGFDRSPGGGRASRTAGFVVERFVASGADTVYVPSMTAEEHLVHTLRVPGTKVSMVGAGVDLGRFASDRTPGAPRGEQRARWGASADDIVCGVVGAPWARDLEVAVRSALGDAAGPLVRCVELDPLRVPSAAARAEFFGAVDVVVLAARRGVGPGDTPAGPSNAVMAQEVAACARVAIVGEHHGIRLVVEDSRTGYVMGASEVGAAAERVVDLLADPARRERMEHAARAKAVREFDSKRVVEAVLESYALHDEPCASGPTNMLR